MPTDEVYYMGMETMSWLWRATGPFFFIAAPIMVALSYRKPASGGKSRDSCGAEDSYKRKLTIDDSSAYAKVTSTEYDYVACMIYYARRQRLLW